MNYRNEPGQQTIEARRYDTPPSGIPLPPGIPFAPTRATEPIGSGDFGAIAGMSFSDGIVGIRKFRHDDASELLAAVRESVWELSSWLTWCRQDFSLEDSNSFVQGADSKWAKGEGYYFVIFSAADGKFLGSVGLNQINPVHKTANLGYWIRNSQTRHGFASAAVRLAARFALHELGFNRLELVIPTDNRSSRKVAERVGAVPEGVLRNRIMLQGKHADAIMYSLVAGDSCVSAIGDPAS